MWLRMFADKKDAVVRDAARCHGDDVIHDE